MVTSLTISCEGTITKKVLGKLWGNMIFPWSIGGPPGNKKIILALVGFEPFSSSWMSFWSWAREWNRGTYKAKRVFSCWWESQSMTSLLLFQLSCKARRGQAICSKVTLCKDFLLASYGTSLPFFRWCSEGNSTVIFQCEITKRIEGFELALYFSVTSVFFCSLFFIMCRSSCWPSCYCKACRHKGKLSLFCEFHWLVLNWFSCFVTSTNKIREYVITCNSINFRQGEAGEGWGGAGQECPSCRKPFINFSMWNAADLGTLFIYLLSWSCKYARLWLGFIELMWKFKDVYLLKRPWEWWLEKNTAVAT